MKKNQIIITPFAIVGFLVLVTVSYWLFSNKQIKIQPTKGKPVPVPSVSIKDPDTTYDASFVSNTPLGWECVAPYTRNNLPPIKDRLNSCKQTINGIHPNKQRCVERCFNSYVPSFAPK